MFLEDILVLLDDDEAVDRGREIADERVGVGPREAELEDRGFGEGLAHVAVGEPLGYDAELLVARLYFVQRAFFRLGAEVIESRLDLFPHLAAPYGERAKARGVSLEMGFFGRRPFAGLDETSRMAHARREAEHDGNLIPFRELEAVAHGRERLARVGGLEHRNLREAREVPGVLLVLRRVLARVVGHADDHAALASHVGKRHEGVGGDVEADVLHRDDRARARVGGAGRGLEGNLFVGCPFEVHVVLSFREIFEDLGRGGSGIAEGGGDARFPGAARDGFVAGQKSFHYGRS